MNLTGFQVLIRKKPASLFYYFLAGLLVNETIYLILTESQAIFNDYLVGIIYYNYQLPIYVVII